ncbi:transcriptional regulator [Aliivibrio sp. S4TY2]|uniref:Glycine cleavage system transcriptional repressor n=1 Tax=Aliivibrio finisterrensis TaxID=511998 RepID=A0A6N6RS72_9GAMM|nr:MULTISPECIES: ACT domain-containing protein [Aliivibrio]KAB2824443.1 transcriptional regulator [Aliivibrio finisterrensis]MDD9155392.1 transcriptional regulator [Aliivibrio sp. S4TY2]MDD9161519.1 transcriptional regulator [Aliivibrio sp. S4TY1]MDD9165549.1 transcriptional regulator [Aliivibrio sp. S4MY2]MDD9169548.1 transcriptional regulator [Aliivibrio sp. S4MY4]
MKSVFIAAFVGISSPDLIKRLASVTHEEGGKWLVSKVHYLDAHISAVIKIEVPTSRKKAVQDYFSSQDDLIVTFSDALETIVEHQHTRLKVDAEDRAGIVNDISNILQKESVELIDMDSHRIGVPANGSSVFTATLSLKLPISANINDLAAEIEALSEDMVVTVI